MQGDRRKAQKYYEKGKAGLSGARPIRRTKGNRHCGSTVDASFRVGARNPNLIEITKKRHLEESTSQEPDAGGNVKMCRHVLPNTAIPWGSMKTEQRNLIIRSIRKDD